MMKGGNVMEQIVTFTTKELAHRKSTITITTFYELIKAISEELQPGEENLLSYVVIHLLVTGRVKFIGNTEMEKYINKYSSDIEESEVYVEIDTDTSNDTLAGHYYNTFETDLAQSIAGL
jgi:hypothetical protein